MSDAPPLPDRTPAACDQQPATAPPADRPRSRVSRPAIGLVSGGAIAAGLALLLWPAARHDFAPVSGGPTGHLSDRALELDAVREQELLLERSAEAGRGPLPASPAAAPGWLVPWLAADLRDRIEELGRADVQLFPERASFRYELLAHEQVGPDRLRVRYRGRLTSYVERDELPLPAGGWRAAYQDRDGWRFRLPDDAVRAGARPELATLVQDGRLTIGVLFGQLRVDELRPTDMGYVGLAELRDRLVGLGFVGAGERLRRRSPGLEVEVRLYGPAHWPRDASGEATAALLRELIRSSEILYVNGHSNLDGLHGLFAVDPYRTLPYRILVLDLCHSYYLYPTAILAAMQQAGVRGHVVSTAERTVTGSVGSFAALLEPLLEAGRSTLPPAPRAAPTWIALLREMNDRAVARAVARRPVVRPGGERAEVYGVSGVE